MGIVVPRAHHKCPPQFRRLYPPQHRMQRPACGEAEVNFISRYCGPHIAERIQPPRLMVSQSIVPKTGLPAYSFFVSSVTAQTWNLECKPICRTFPDLSATVGTDGGFPLPTRLCRGSHWSIICLQSATADDLGLFQATKIPFVFRPQFKHCARPLRRALYCGRTSEARHIYSHSPCDTCLWAHDRILISAFHSRTI